MSDTAKKTGKPRSTVARDATRGKKVKVLPDIVGTSLDKGDEWQQPLTMSSCMVGMPALADYMRSFPQYRLQSWRCTIDVPTKEHA